MGKQYIQLLILWPLLIVMQALVFNHIMLFNVAVPFVFIYFILRLPVGMSVNWLLTLSFITGAVMDIFSDTSGIYALSCTVLAIVKRPVFFAYVSKDDSTKFIFPGVGSIGWPNYSKFLITMSTIFSVMAFGVEYLRMLWSPYVWVMIAASALLTALIIFPLDCIIGVRKS